MGNSQGKTDSTATIEGTEVTDIPKNITGKNANDNATIMSAGKSTYKVTDKVDLLTEVEKSAF
jgi:hypothetical protein